MNLAPSRLPHPPRGGYALLELVAVLTVLAILATVVTTNVFNRMKRSARETEANTLSSMAAALKQHIRRAKTVPAATNWADAIAAELAQPLQKVTQTPPGNARVFLVDPALRLGTNGGQMLPYQQSVAGSVQPISPRLLLIASLAKPLPAITTNDFTTLWNTPKDSAPAGWAGEWSAMADDLKIERIDLGPLFYRVILNNLDINNTANYSIETNSPVGIASGNHIDAWFLDSTVLGFHYTNGWLQAREFLHEDSSYVYERNRWGRNLTFGKDNQSGLFGQLVDMFLDENAPPPDPNQFGTTQQSIIDEFYTFLWTYGAWASEGFPKGGSSSAQQVPSFRMVTDAQVRMSSFTANLLKD